ncbi:class II fructose-bisphosphate aldolase [Streptomyces sp. NPDC014776]|uniref:class II fructose-bisphosphate aldolase n=1 Tax=unclassified Streptomyces TaxID=2593676 RepID=UPI0036F853C7
MPLAAAGALLTDATARRRAVAAFPVLTLDQAQAVVEGAETVRSPVIVQLGPEAVRHHAGRLLPLARAVAELAELATVPVALHLDRVRSTALLAQAAHARFSSVLYDAGRLPWARNVATTREVVRWAHEQGLWAEGEWTGPADPDTVRGYARATGVDSLVLTDPTAPARLGAVLDVPLVVRAALPRAAAGAAKVVLGPALDAALTRALSDRLARDPHPEPGGYLAAAHRAMAATAARLIGTLDASPPPPHPSKEHPCPLPDEERSARPSPRPSP